MSMAQVKALRSKLGTKLFDKLLAESEDSNLNAKTEVPSEDEAESDENDDEMPEEESSKKVELHFNVYSVLK